MRRCLVRSRTSRVVVAEATNVRIAVSVGMIWPPEKEREMVKGDSRIEVNGGLDVFRNNELMSYFEGSRQAEIRGGGFGEDGAEGVAMIE